MKSRLKIWEISALAAICAALCVGTWAQGRQDAVSSKLLRLHVIAASDSPEEQRIKLKVRDAVLGCLEPELVQAGSADQLRQLIAGSIEDIAASAASAAQGRSVELRLCTRHYSTREYAGLTLPAGDYQTLQVILGAGEGHNWWGVIFPPVCLPAYAAEDAESAMGGGDYSLVSREEGYELRFRAVELWGELMALINEN